MLHSEKVRLGGSSLAPGIDPVLLCVSCAGHLRGFVAGNTADSWRQSGGTHQGDDHTKEDTGTLKKTLSKGFGDKRRLTIGCRRRTAPIAGGETRAHHEPGRCAVRHQIRSGHHERPTFWRISSSAEKNHSIERIPSVRSARATGSGFFDPTAREAVHHRQDTHRAGEKTPSLPAYPSRRGEGSSTPSATCAALRKFYQGGNWDLVGNTPVILARIHQRPELTMPQNEPTRLSASATRTTLLG